MIMLLSLYQQYYSQVAKLMSKATSIGILNCSISKKNQNLIAIPSGHFNCLIVISVIHFFKQKLCLNYTLCSYFNLI